MIRIVKRTAVGVMILLICSFSHSQVLNGLAEKVLPLADGVVAADGSGDYSTLQKAIDAVPDHSQMQTVLFIRKGVYREKVLIPASKKNLTLIGEHVDSTIVVWDDYSGRIVNGEEINTFTSQTIRIEPDDFRAMNLTFANDARPGGSGDGQNVAVSTYGKRQLFIHCKMISWQDTYFSGSNGRTYVKDCWIEGAVDYIFGHAAVVFDSCQIHTVRSGGYITAASTEADYHFGYVFFDCRLTAPPVINGVYLGRPWKNHPRTVFFQCVEYENIIPAGWRTWGGTEENAFYAEYQCTGPGSDTSRRVEWSRQLTHEEASTYELENIFSSGTSPDFGTDWQPALAEDTLYKLVMAHTVPFMDSVNLDARIASLTLNGEPLEEWDPDRTEYSVEIPEDTEVPPVLSATARNPLATVEISYPESLPGFSEVTVLASDKSSHSTYSIYFSIDSSYTDTRLDSIYLDGKELEGFDPSIYDYEIILPKGTSKYFALTGYPHVAAARVKTIKPAELPGVATIEVTAVSGANTAIYRLNISLATTGSGEADRWSGPSLRVSSSREDIVLFPGSPLPSPAEIRIYGINGTTAWAGNMRLPGGEASLELPVRLEAGIYICIIRSFGTLAKASFVVP